MRLLDNKVLISVESDNGPRRYFNRITQGFTCRWNGESFYDTTGCAVRPYFKGFKQHKQSEYLWVAMEDKDPELVYHKFTFGLLRTGRIVG